MLRSLMLAFASLSMVAVLGSTSGCASNSSGTKMDQAQIGQIQKGVTTRAQIEKMFGPPDTMSLMGDGRRMMLYSYTSTDTHVKGTSFIPYAGIFMSGSEGKTEHQQLQVILTSNDVVQDYVFSDGTRNIDVSDNGFSST